MELEKSIFGRSKIFTTEKIFGKKSTKSRFFPKKLKLSLKFSKNFEIFPQFFDFFVFIAFFLINFLLPRKFYDLLSKTRTIYDLDPPDPQARS